jgi:hypothetical protein
VEPGRSTHISTQVRGLTMAYTERRERKKDTRYQSADTLAARCRHWRLPRRAERRAAEAAGPPSREERIVSHR